MNTKAVSKVFGNERLPSFRTDTDDDTAYFNQFAWKLPRISLYTMVQQYVVKYRKYFKLKIAFQQY